MSARGGLFCYCIDIDKKETLPDAHTLFDGVATSHLRMEDILSSHHFLATNLLFESAIAFTQDGKKIHPILLSPAEE